MNPVPCNGCTRCCRGDRIRLLPGDDASQYHTQPHDNPRHAGQLMLARKPNGDCVYLADTGCTIHDRSPRMCRDMDCRVIAQRLTFTRARQLNIVHIYRRGKDLLRERRP